MVNGSKGFVLINKASCVVYCINNWGHGVYIESSCMKSFTVWSRGICYHPHILAYQPMVDYQNEGKQVLLTVQTGLFVLLTQLKLSCSTCMSNLQIMKKSALLSSAIAHVFIKFSAAGHWFSLDTRVSITYKTGSHDSKDAVVKTYSTPLS